jgi:hypothetical protein
VEENEVEQMIQTLSSATALGVSSETRFLQSGGNCHHAGAFPFAEQPEGFELGIWRKRVKYNKRRRLDNRCSVYTSNVFSRDVVINILRFCDIQTLVRAAQVSREWRIAEEFANDTWQRCFFRKWPDAKQRENQGESTGYKARFHSRIAAARSLKIPLGRKTIPRPVFCPFCDLAFLNTSIRNKHTCKIPKSKGHADRVKRKQQNLIQQEAV